MEVPQSPGCNSPKLFFLKIAETIIKLSCDDPAISLCLEGAAERFRIAGGNPDVYVRAQLSEIAETSAGRRVFDSGGLWRLYLAEGLYRFEFVSPLFGDRPYKIALFDRDFVSGEVRLQRPFFEGRNPVYPLQYPLDELLMLNLLAKGRGIEVHACGLADAAGRGYLFVGQSGAGKSTMAKLWQSQPGVRILSDDRIILRQEDRKIRMYGTPWHGEGLFASPECVTLDEVLFLRHGLKNARLPKAGATAAALLFSCAFPPFYSREGLEFTLAFIELVVRSVPCHELWSVPDRRILEFIQSNSM